jgi:hypothetical protein
MSARIMLERHSRFRGNDGGVCQRGCFRDIADPLFTPAIMHEDMRCDPGRDQRVAAGIVVLRMGLLRVA